jgi:hypothetical protein
MGSVERNGISEPVDRREVPRFAGPDRETLQALVGQTVHH